MNKSRITCVVPVYMCLISFRKFRGTYTILSLKKQSLNICTSMFIVVLVTIAKRQKHLNCSSADKWISKMWYVHTMEHYSALKRKEMLTQATI